MTMIDWEDFLKSLPKERQRRIKRGVKQLEAQCAAMHAEDSAGGAAGGRDISLCRVASRIARQRDRGMP